MRPTNMEVSTKTQNAAKANKTAAMATPKTLVFAPGSGFAPVRMRKLGA
jgi:hypothetical protein